MVMSEEESGFKVKDRRLFSEDGSEREPDDASEPKSERETENADARGPGDQPHTAAGEEMPSGRFLPPVDFSTFILSLSHAVMLHLGQVPDPGSGQTHKDMELARHTIDTIAMLQQKTKGNLDPDEQGLIDNILAELRLAYVRLNQ